MITNEESKIFSMVDTIFFNIGYRRRISGIQVLKNQQIYFQICNFIFPANSIQMRIIRQSKLTNSQKIQQLINLVGRQITNDLSHISGFQIASGNLLHLSNFLHLILQLTDQQIITEIKSAPPRKNSISDLGQFDISYCTVMGVPQQFFYTEYEPGSQAPPEIKNMKIKKQSKRSNDEQKIVRQKLSEIKINYIREKTEKIIELEKIKVKQMNKHQKKYKKQIFEHVRSNVNHIHNQNNFLRKQINFQSNNMQSVRQKCHINKKKLNRVLKKEFVKNKQAQYYENVSKIQLQNKRLKTLINDNQEIHTLMQQISKF